MCVHCCECALGWVKCRGQIPSMGHHTWPHTTSLSPPFPSVDEAGSRMICANIDAFRQIGIGAFPSKTKVTLILCVFSGSDVGSKWWLLYSLLHPTTKHLNRLIWDILSSPAPEADSSQLTQGGSKVRWSCQSTIVGGACTELRHSDRNLRTAWFEKEDFKIGILKNGVSICTKCK